MRPIGVGRDVLTNKDFFDIFKPRRSSTFPAMAEEGMHRAVDAYVMQNLQYPVDPWTGYPMWDARNTFAQEEFEAKYGDELEYDPNMTEEAAEYILHRRKQREVNEYIISKGQHAIVDYVAEFGINTATSFLDPIVLGSTLIPISSPAFIAKYGGKFAGGLFAGATGGVVGGIADVPARAYGRHLMQEEYTLDEAMSTIGYSAAGGAILGAGVSGVRYLKDSWKLHKTNNAMIDAELQDTISGVINKHTHPEGIKSDITPLEKLQQEKLTLHEEFSKKFPEYSALELETANFEQKIHEEYFTNRNEGNLPKSKIEEINQQKEILSLVHEAHSNNPEFLEFLAKREKLNEATIDTIKHIQHKSNAYEFNGEDLHIAMEQLKSDKRVNLSDPLNAKSIYETHENITFNKVDDEVKHFFSKEDLSKFNLNNPEGRRSAIDAMLLHKNIDFVEQNLSAKVGLKQLVENTELRSKVISKKYLCDFYLDLEKSDLLHYFETLQAGFLKPRNKKLELDVARELANLSSKQNPHGYTGSNIALNLSKLIYKHQQNAIAGANARGGEIASLSGYITRQSHCPTRIKKMGYESWRDFIVPLLDIEKTGEVDLKQMFNNIVTGKHLNTIEGEFSGYTGSSNLAKNLSAERKLHFRSAEGWHKYNEVAGEYGLANNVSMNLERLGKATGLLETLGTNPKNQLQNLKNTFTAKLQDKVAIGDLIASNDFAYINKPELDNILDNIIGISPQNMNGANLAKNIRSIKSMASLGRVALSSIPDTAIATTTLQNNMIPVVSSYAKLLSTTASQFNRSQKKEFAQMLGIASESMLGSMYDRLYSEGMGSGAITGNIAKMNNLFFKLNFMDFWDRTIKTGVGTILSNNLAKLSTKPYLKLTPQYRNLLSKYGIDKSNWAEIKSFKAEVNGSHYILPNLDNKLSNNIRSYIFDQVNHAIIAPNASEKALMFQGTKEGSWGGEALRFLVQFKQFPITFVSRSMKASTIGNIPVHERTGILRQDIAKSLGNWNSIKSMTHLIAATSVLGYYAGWSKLISQGKELPDFEDNPSKLVAFAMAHGGGLGIFGNFLFEEYDSYGKTAWHHLAPPAFDLLEEPIVAGYKAWKGQDSEKQIKNLIKGYTPCQNLFYTERALKALLENND